MSDRVLDLERKANWLRNEVLEMTVAAGAGHIAPSFSCAEILVAIHYGGVLRLDPENPKWEERDRFILSKGQSAVALYAILADLGFFPVEELLTFTQKGSRLGGHTEDTIPGVEAFTGSLGHGLPIAAGLALGARLREKRFLTVALLGDGECHEGSIWEAAMFAGQHRLNNLLAIVDRNGQSATDFTGDYLTLEPMEDKWRAFGWEVRTVDGHSFPELIEAMKDVHDPSYEKPLCIVADTIKGKGVSFMEREPIWHYRIPVDEELDIARRELKWEKK
ncbi:MAG: transketolase [Candidatus Tritonobacter lacicola]|nr:transketolase [Candidatus Tritonobacter lacicola]